MREQGRLLVRFQDDMFLHKYNSELKTCNGRRLPLPQPITFMVRLPLSPSASVHINETQRMQVPRHSSLQPNEQTPLLVISS